MENLEKLAILGTRQRTKSKKQRKTKQDEQQELYVKQACNQML